MFMVLVLLYIANTKYKMWHIVNNINNMYKRLHKFIFLFLVLKVTLKKKGLGHPGFLLFFFVKPKG